MSGRAESDFDGATVGILVLLAVPALLAYLKAPQAFGFLIGGLSAAIPIAAGSVDADPERWRGRAVRLIVAGLVTTISFLVLDALIGADAEMRQFSRAWEGSWPRDLSVLADYPWATVPLGAAAGLIGFGAVIALYLFTHRTSR